MISEMFLAIAWLAALLAGPDTWFRDTRLLYADDFTHGLARWIVEAEKPGRVTAGGGQFFDLGLRQALLVGGVNEDR